MSKEERFDLAEYKGDALNLTASSGLLSLDWARDIAHEIGTVPVLTAGALVSSDSELPPDHLVRTSSLFIRSDVIKEGTAAPSYVSFRTAHRGHRIMSSVGDSIGDAHIHAMAMHALKRPRYVLQFSTLLHTGLLHDMLCLYNSERQQFHTLVTLGANVCGHPRITHGGEPPQTFMCHQQFLSRITLARPCSGKTMLRQDHAPARVIAYA